MILAKKLFTIALAVASSAMISGCKDKISASSPRVLGIPAQVAYLGVEYEYNFGADGGEGFLDYSLSNAPDWLALEETLNKTRHGIIGRGVPGITGGRRGDLDLGKFENVAITVNDGKRTGTNTFEIEVKHNTLALVDVTVTEGDSNGRKPESTTSSDTAQSTTEQPANECVKPSGELKGSYTVDGQVYETYPVIMAVSLAQPSVERIQVRYELKSDFVDITNPATQIAQVNQNRSKARPLYDYVSDSQSLNETLSYLQFESAGGVVTFEPGITTCYLRVEVVDDIKAERTESFQVELKEVIRGLASLTHSGAKSKASINIQDNEPIVSFESKSSVINKGSEKVYKARLDREVDREVHARIVAAPDGTLTSDYYSLSQAGFGSTADGDVLVDLVFPPKVTEVEYVLTVGSSLAKAGETYTGDRLINLAFKEEFTDSSARTEEKVLGIYVNEWLNTLSISSEAGKYALHSQVLDKDQNVFIIGDMLVGENNRDGILKTFDRTGAVTALGMDQPLASADGGNEIAAALNYIYRPNSAKTSKEDESLHQLVAVYNTDSREGSFGGKDILVRSYERIANVAQYSLMWEARVGTPGDDTATAVTLDSSGNVYVVGYTNGNIAKTETQEAFTNKGGFDGYLAKLDLTGKLVWQSMLSTPGDDLIVAADSTGANIVVAGTTTDNLAAIPYGGKDVFIAKYGINGQKASSDRQIGTYLDDIVTSVASSASGILIAGATMGDIGHNVLKNEDLEAVTRSSVDFYVMSFGGSNVLGSRVHTGTENTDVMNKIIAADTVALVGGYVEGAFNSNNHLGGQDALIAAYQTDPAKIESTSDNPLDTSVIMTLLWSVQFGGAENDAVLDLDTFNTAKLYSLSNTTKAGELHYLVQLREAATGAELSR